MKNRKQILADFYLDLLTVKDEVWRQRNKLLYTAILGSLANELDSDPETVHRIFVSMAREDDAV